MFELINVVLEAIIANLDLFESQDLLSNLPVKFYNRTLLNAIMVLRGRRFRALLLVVKNANPTVVEVDAIEPQVSHICNDLLIGLESDSPQSKLESIQNALGKTQNLVIFIDGLI